MTTQTEHVFHPNFDPYKVRVNNDYDNTRLSLKQYVQAVRRQFVHYGFPSHPLGTTDMRKCYEAGLTVGDAYSVGCDVNSGYGFADCLSDYV